MVRHTLGLCYLPRHKICKTKQILLFALYRNNQHLSWARNGWLGNITHLGYATVKSVFSCHVLLWIMLVVLPFGENEITLTKEKHFIVCTVFDIFHQSVVFQKLGTQIIKNNCDVLNKRETSHNKFVGLQLDLGS